MSKVAIAITEDMTVDRLKRIIDWGLTVEAAMGGPVPTLPHEVPLSKPDAIFTTNAIPAWQAEGKKKPGRKPLTQAQKAARAAAKDAVKDVMGAAGYIAPTPVSAVNTAVRSRRSRAKQPMTAMAAKLRAEHAAINGKHAN